MRGKGGLKDWGSPENMERSEQRRLTCFHPLRSVVKGAPRAICNKGMDMSAEADSKEVTVHQVGYERFTTLMKWSTGVAVVIAFIVILLIAK
jgi:voltage-gated potassium channel Kch